MFNPRLLRRMPTYDVTSNICQVLPPAGASRRRERPHPRLNQWPRPNLNPYPRPRSYPYPQPHPPPPPALRPPALPLLLSRPPSRAGQILLATSEVCHFSPCRRRCRKKLLIPWADIARHVIGCHLTQETMAWLCWHCCPPRYRTTFSSRNEGRSQTRVNDVARYICQAPRRYLLLLISRSRRRSLLDRRTVSSQGLAGIATSWGAL